VSCRVVTGQVEFGLILLSKKLSTRTHLIGGQRTLSHSFADAKRHSEETNHSERNAGQADDVRVGRANHKQPISVRMRVAV